MATPLLIERLRAIHPGENFDLPDGWVFYTYKCMNSATITITNSLGETITDKGSGSSYYSVHQGFGSLKFTANGGDVLLKWF